MMRPNKALALAVWGCSALCAGCLVAPKGLPEYGCQPFAEPQQSQTIHVKAPPQKIVIEQPDCPPAAESPKGQRETAPQPRPETSRQPQRETNPQRPQTEAEQESAAGTLAALGQIASLTRTVAMTHPLGTVNPGSSALGIGITWIHIPVPFPRIFSVEETPTVTVPLSEANLVSVGYNGQVGTGQGGGRTLSRDEINRLVAQEIAAQRQRVPRQEAAPSCPPADDAERRHLEKKLSDAEAQIDNLSKILKSLDDKIPAPKPLFPLQ
jgi:hypothetical protein